MQNKGGEMSEKEMKEQEMVEESVEKEEEALSQEENEESTPVEESSVESEEKSDEKASEAEEESSHEIEESDEEDEVVSTPSGNRPEDIVESARERVSSAEKEVQEALEAIEEKLDEFIEYEKSALAPIVDESRRIVQKVGMQDDEIGELPEPKADFTLLKEAKGLDLQSISSGKGGAFFLSLIFGAATLGGWYMLATKGSGAVEGLNMAVAEKLASKISTLLSLGGSAQAGMAVVVVSTLIVMWIVYSIKVGLQTSKNIEIAKEIEEKANEYCERKNECKLKVLEVADSIRDINELVRKYEVLLDEKNATLRRALYLENTPDFEELHERSKKELEHMIGFIREIETLLSIPLAKNGELNAESLEAIEETKELLEKHIHDIYNA
jgi:hypothetical protein